MEIAEIYGLLFLYWTAHFFLPNVFLKQLGISVCRISILAPVNQISNSREGKGLSLWFVLAVSSMSLSPSCHEQSVHLFPLKEGRRERRKGKEKKTLLLALMTSSVINELIKISESSGAR